MESFTRPAFALLDALSWFVRAREARVFYVRTSPDLRATALRLVAAQELHPENSSPWVLLEDPSTSDSDGWLERSERLRIQHETRRERMAAEGEQLPSLPERPSADDPVTTFGMQLGQLLSARSVLQDGLVVVMAPTRVEDPVAFRDSILALLAVESLRAVRWVFVDAGAAPLEPIATQAGDQAMRALLLVEEAEAQRDLARIIDAAERVPADVSGPARVGAAWPIGISPPARVNRPPADPEAIDAMLRDEGVHLPLAGTRGVELSRAVLRGAQALRSGNTEEAVLHQARARDVCVEADMPREATVMELVLGAYFLAAHDPGRAEATYHAASERAGRAGLPALGAQAELALGALYLRAGEQHKAAMAYTRGAELARQAGSTILTIEALRHAGQVQLASGREEETLSLWKAAIELAVAAPESARAEVKASSAAEVAHELAALLRKRGLQERAVALEELSRGFE